MSTANADRFLRSSLLYCRLMGFNFEKKSQRIFIFGLMNEVFNVLGQFAYFGSFDIDIRQKTLILVYLNYYFMSLTKGLLFIYNRNAILGIFNQFRQMSPTEELEKDYKLRTFSRQYRFIENFQIVFFWTVLVVHCFQPLIGVLLDLVFEGKLTFKLPWIVWYGIEGNNLFYYIFIYTSEVYSTYMSATILLANDLCLFNSLMQLNMHLDILKKNILKIEPDETPEATAKLIKEIIKHQKLMRLAEKLNIVFTPSVICSLLSSSLIICFTGLQLLGELSFIKVVKAISLLAYELKEVAIVCFLGDTLIANSLKISDAIYEHKWYNATPKYKRLVLMFLFSAQRSITLHIAGIADISLQTFQKVMSISYQIFTVLRSR